MDRRLRGQAHSHRDLCRVQDHSFNTEPCGSEPARESARSGNHDAECTAAFVGKPTPTGICAGLKIIRSTPKPVGASLLAKAPDQAITMLNVPTPSWASPLPQESALGRDRRFNTEPCGSELARESARSGNHDAECTAAFVSKLTPTGICAGPRPSVQHRNLWERACSRKRQVRQSRC